MAMPRVLDRPLFEYDWSMMNLGERLERQGAVLGGQPVVRGTRVPVRALVGSLAGGMTIEQVCASYRVTVEDVRAALGYAAQVLDEDRARGDTSSR
jgi:uncharacterized protein (DUF433 family)